MIPYTNPPRPKNNKKVDIFGSLTLLLGVSSLDVSFTVLTYKQWILSGVLFVVSVLILICFFIIERKAEDPVLPLYLLKNPVSDYVVVSVLIFFSTMGL